MLMKSLIALSIAIFGRLGWAPETLTRLPNARADLLLLSWLGVAVFVITISGSKWGRFFVSVLPGFLLLAALPVARAIDWAQQQRTRAPVLVACCAAAAALLIGGEAAAATRMSITTFPIAITSTPAIARRWNARARFPSLSVRFSGQSCADPVARAEARAREGESGRRESRRPRRSAHTSQTSAGRG